MQTEQFTEQFSFSEKKTQLAEANRQSNVYRTKKTAPASDEEEGDHDNEASMPKSRRIDQQDSFSQQKEWCKVKLATLYRALEFTQPAEFVDANQYAVQTRLEMLETCWNEFGVVVAALLSMGAEGRHDDINLERAEEIYVAAKAALRSRLAVLTTQSHQSASNVVQIQWSDMPGQEKLPSFAGDFAKWAPFRDAFIAEVHNNQKLSNAQRLRKLLGSLEGAAKRAVGEWSVADDGNYILAWTSLRQQYDNNHLTIRAHMQEISGLLPIRDKSFEDLRDVLDTVRVNRRHLLSLLTPEQLVDYQFLHQIESVLDAEGRREWEMRRRINELPSLDEMFAFLEQRANCMASLATTSGSRTTAATSRDELRQTPKPPTTSVQRVPLSSQPTPVNQHSGRVPISGNEPKRLTDNRKCFKCEMPGHALFRCEQFKTMTINDRRDFVVKRRLCESCFSPNHLTTVCRKEACHNCPGIKHNSTICPNNSRSKAEGTAAQANFAGGTQ